MRSHDEQIGCSVPQNNCKLFTRKNVLVWLKLDWDNHYLEKCYQAVLTVWMILSEILCYHKKWNALDCCLSTFYHDQHIFGETVAFASDNYGKIMVLL